MEATWRPLAGHLEAKWAQGNQVVLQEAPSWSQEAESWAQETPSWPQEAPSWLEEAPSWLQEAPKRLQVGPNRCPRGPEELSESSPAVFEQPRGQNLEFARPYHTLEGFGRACRSVWRAKWSLSCARRSAEEPNGVQVAFGGQFGVPSGVQVALGERLERRPGAPKGGWRPTWSTRTFWTLCVP